MGIPIWHVDAFSSQPFGGNPAAVCLLPAPREPVWMQLVAREMNLSETAFLSPCGSEWALRWFTPTTEVALCGHATLASAHALWESGGLAAAQAARFQTRSGLLTARRAGAEIELDFPAQPLEVVPEPIGFSEALGGTPRFVRKAGCDLLAEFASPREVRALRPDMARLATYAERGIIVTARSDAAEYDFISRFFAPAAGVDEDPVTGSAHCALGPFWSARLGKLDLVGWQASARGGRVGVGVRGERVLLRGNAVTVFHGEMP